jgi:hypothetical protein
MKRDGLKMSGRNPRIQSSKVVAAQVKTEGRTWLDKIGLALAIGWILTPAIQYFGTVQRTELMLQGDAAYPSLARLDLITVYYLLLAFTVLLVMIRFTMNRQAEDSGNSLNKHDPTG